MIAHVRSHTRLDYSPSPHLQSSKILHVRAISAPNAQDSLAALSLIYCTPHPVAPKPTACDDAGLHEVESAALSLACVSPTTLDLSSKQQRAASGCVSPWPLLHRSIPQSRCNQLSAPKWCGAAALVLSQLVRYQQHYWACCGGWIL
jgi:hypothetical protein